MPEIFAYLPIFSYLCRSNRDATATSALRSPSTTLYLIINPIYDPAQFQRLVDFLKTHNLTDQLLTGNGWLHISWNPFGIPRHYVRIAHIALL